MALVSAGQVGILRVQVLEGRNLIPCDRSGLSDPYVVVTCGHSSKKTRHLRQTLNPIWTAQEKNLVEFKVDDRTPGIVQLEVFDWNRIAASKRMGMVELRDLNKLLDGGKKSLIQWMPLAARKEGDKVSGDLKVQIDLLEGDGGSAGGGAAGAAGAAAGGGAEDAQGDEESELEKAIKAGDLAAVQTLMKEVVDVNRQDRLGYTPLHAAAVQFSAHDAEIVTEILDHKDIDVNVENTQKATALHYFCQRYRSPNCGDVLQKFIERGANVNKQNDQGETPLHRATQNQAVRIILVRGLVDNGADPNIQTIKGDTPLHYAVEQEREDLVTILIEGGASLTIKNKADNRRKSETPLEIAERYEQVATLARMRAAEEIYTWLDKLELGKYGPLFLKNKLYMADLPAVDEVVLNDLGISTTGHRVKLLAACRQLAATEGGSSSKGASTAGAGGKGEEPGSHAGASAAGSVSGTSDEVVDDATRDQTIQEQLEQMKYIKKSDWVLHNSELEFTVRIGVGAAGTVYRGLYCGKDVAIKVLKTEQTENEIMEFKKEFQIMSSIEHPNLVFFFGAVLEPRLCMVLEMCTKGSLFDVLNDKEVNLSWDLVFAFSRDMTKGLQALHTWDPQIVHRDFKSLNLLVNSSNVVKVADFGLSRFNTDTAKETLNQLRGTYAYVAQEVYHGKPFSTKSDVFSVALVLWELVRRCCDMVYMRPYQEYPNLHYDFQIIIQTAKKKLRPTFPDQCPEGFRKLIERAWDHEPSERPECEELLVELDKLQADYKKNPDTWKACIVRREVPVGNEKAGAAGAVPAGDGDATADPRKR